MAPAVETAPSDGYFKLEQPVTTPTSTGKNEKDTPYDMEHYQTKRYNATVDAIVSLFPTKRPTSEDRFVIKHTRASWVFTPIKAMEELADVWNRSCGPCRSNKEKLLKLPWAAQWVDCDVRRVDYKRLVDNITHSNCIKILSIYYPLHPPNEDDAVAVALENNDVWYFRAAHWLRQILGVWVSGGIELSDEDRANMQKLSWFEGWMEHELCVANALDLKGATSKRALPKCEGAHGPEPEHKRRCTL